MKSGYLRWAGHVAHIGKMRNAYKIGERPNGRQKDNIGMDLREIGWKFVEWIHLVQ
jgi:hypothetical protein